MKLQPRRFRRAMLLNKSALAAVLPSIAYRVTRTPRFGVRARNILFALDVLRQSVERKRIAFDCAAEFGVASGEGFRQLVILTMHYCAAFGLKVPRFYGFDSFEGLHASDHPADQGAWSAGDYRGNQEAIAGLLKKIGCAEHCVLVPGYFDKTLPTMPSSFAPQFILIDCDYYSSTRDVFDFLKDRLETGTIVYFDDLGVQFFNRNCGEERLIHEVNRGEFGPQYHLEKLWDRCFVWSNADKPILKATNKVLDIPLKQDGQLTDFY